MENFALLENRKTNLDIANSFYFHDEYEEIICCNLLELNSAFARMEELRKQGKFLVGFLSYRASDYFKAKALYFPLKKSSIRIPLLHFLAFNKCEHLTQAAAEQLLNSQAKTKGEDLIYNLNFSFTQQEYFKRFNKIKTYLGTGDTYQVNLTGKYFFNFQGEPLNIYKILREQQRVEYSAFLNFQNYQILSLSPELFFKKTVNKIITKPMKGTINRAADMVQDGKNREILQQDPKNRAENLMIVDLLRNDLGKIAETGSIKVEELFALETFETIHQLVSEITAKIPIEITFVEILKALFPCGSVTGAPKLRTMEIIHELEIFERDIYTGALGFIMPENDMCFSVPIRTVVLQNNQGELGVGSGIVYESDPVQEFAEIQLKAKFLTGIDPAFELVECFLYAAQLGYRYLAKHLRRLQHSAKFFNFYCPLEKIEKALENNKKKLAPNFFYKIKLLLSKKGQIEIINELIVVPSIKSNTIKIAKERLSSKNILLQHKTTASSVRGFYDEMFKKYCADDNCFDTILQNEHGYITQGTRTNIFIAHANEILTPPITAGLLPGIMRQNFIKARRNIIEKNLTVEDLLRADKIWLTNSVRGALPAVCHVD